MTDESTTTQTKKPGAAKKPATSSKTEQEAITKVAGWLNMTPEDLKQPQYKPAYAIVQSLAKNLVGEMDEEEVYAEFEAIFSNPSVAYTLGISADITSRAGEFAEQTGEECGELTSSVIRTKFNQGFARGLQNGQSEEIDTFALGKFQRQATLKQLKDSSSAVGQLPAAEETPPAST
ncbi:MAG: hypothetical protein AAGE92_09655 [Cyanobacteria bacterium P01_G01_bin.4]